MNIFSTMYDIEMQFEVVITDRQINIINKQHLCLGSGSFNP